ncbi:MAG: hypothetical protein AAGA60_31245 [Cyanobacteria bacterium P01_E01_bin.42]
MAKLPPERQALIWDSKQKLLEIIDLARKAEFDLLENWGETEDTLPALDQLTEIAQQAKDRFSQLSTLQVLVAESQPLPRSDLLKLLDARLTIIQNRIPALERSIQEIKLDWNLN